MRQNARPGSSISPLNTNYSSKHKTFRYVPRSVSQAQARKISTENQPKAEEKKKRITQPKQPPPEPPIPSYLNKKKSDIQTPRSKTKKKEQLLNDPGCIALREHFYDNGDFENYDDDKLKILIEHLREYSSFCVLYRQYDEAEQANDLQERIKEELQVRTSNLLSQDKNSDNNGEGCLTKELQKIQDELEIFDFQTNEKLDQLNSKIEKEIDSFEEKWREEMPSKYRKPSTKLITIYDIERKLGLNKDFEKAKKVKAEAEQLEMIEMEKAQNQLIHDYQIARQKLDQKHEDERRHLIETRALRKELLESRLKVVKGSLQNRNTVVTMKQNESLKTKENFFDPNSRSPVSGGGSAINRRDVHNKGINLLPPLLPPNDQKIKEKSEKELKEQRRKNQKFIKRIKEKEREADESDISFSSRDDWDNDLNKKNQTYLKSRKVITAKRRSEYPEKVDDSNDDFLSSYQSTTSEKVSTTKTSTTSIENGSKIATKSKNSKKIEYKNSSVTKSDTKTRSVSSASSKKSKKSFNQFDDLIEKATSNLIGSYSQKNDDLTSNSSNKKSKKSSKKNDLTNSSTKEEVGSSISSKKDDLNSSSKRDNFLSSSKKDDLTSSSKKEKLTDSSKKNDLSSSNKNDDLTSSSKKSDLSSSIRKDDSLSSTKKEDLSNSTKKEDLSNSTKKDNLSSSTKKEDLSNSIKKEDLSSSTKKDDLSSSIKKDDFLSSTKKDDLSSSIKKDDLSSSTKKEDLSSSTNKDDLSSSIKKDDFLSSSKKVSSTDSDHDDNDKSKDADKEDFENFSEDNKIVSDKKKEKESETSESSKNDLDKSKDLSSLASILSFQSSASNKNQEGDNVQSDDDSQNKTDMFDLTRTKSFKSDKTPRETE